MTFILCSSGYYRNSLCLSLFSAVLFYRNSLHVIYLLKFYAIKFVCPLFCAVLNITGTVCYLFRPLSGIAGTVCLSFI